MKTHPVLAFAVFFLALAPTIRAAVLFKETFETPTGKTFEFPVADNYQAHLDDRVSGWSGNGAVGITYDKGLGEKGSGGLKIGIVRAGTDYGVLNVRVPIPTIKPGLLTVEQLKAMTLVYSIRGSEFLTISPLVQPAVKADWAVRLAAPEVVLSKQWTVSRFAFAKSKPEELAAVVEAYNAGTKAELVVGFYLKDFADWQVGDFFLFDNVSLETTAR